MKKICKIKPYRFEEKYLILALENEWSGIFEDVEFDVYIFQNRLYIRSQPIRK